jgi:hypothetical protein
MGSYLKPVLEFNPKFRDLCILSSFSVPLISSRCVRLIYYFKPTLQIELRIENIEGLFVEMVQINKPTSLITSFTLNINKHSNFSLFTKFKLRFIYLKHSHYTLTSK